MATIRDTKGLSELVHQMSELEHPTEIWSHFLDSIKKITNSHSSFLQQNDLRIEHQPSLISRGVDQSLINQYLSYYYSKDIWAGSILASQPGTFHNIQQLVDQKVYLASELFTDLQRYQHSYFGAGLQLNVRNQTGIMLTFHRDLQQGPFDNDDVRLLNDLIPVLYETLWRISDNFLLKQQDRHAVAYINMDNKLVEANSTFYQMCSESNDIELKEDRLSLLNPSKMSELESGYRLLFDAKNDREEDVSINLYDKNGDISYSFRLIPCHNRITRFGFCVPGPFVQLEMKSYQRLQIHWDRIQAHYKLTKAEVSVLKLVNRAYSRKEIARQRHCSPETVKSQMSALQKKLNVKSQVELIRKIHSHSYYLEKD